MTAHAMRFPEFPVVLLVAWPPSPQSSASAWMMRPRPTMLAVVPRNLMKCSLPPRDADFYVDSLYYEYLVGHCFVNDCNRQFPCFLETYGAFGVTDRRVIHTMAELAKNRENTFPVENMTHYLQKFRTFHRIDDFAQQIAISCKNQFNICVLIQHISASDSMKSHFLKRYQDNNYYYYELPQLLYQVYAPLYPLRFASRQRIALQFGGRQIHPNALHI